MTNIRGAMIVLATLFGLGAYYVATPAVTMITNFASNNQAVQSLGYGSSLGNLEFVTLILAPLFLVGGVVLWFAKFVVRREANRGRRR
jgi:hypothetical protein